MSFVTGLLIWVLLLPHIEYLLRARKHHNELINARETPAQVKNIIETSKINMMYFVWKQVSHWLGSHMININVIEPRSNWCSFSLIMFTPCGIENFIIWNSVFGFCIGRKCMMCAMFSSIYPNTNQCIQAFRQQTFKPTTTVILYKRKHENCVMFYTPVIL